MYKYLPSKKFILIFLSILLALGIIYLPFFLKNLKIKRDKLALSENAIPGQKLPSLDADNDGLKDWEETLRGTNTNNPDTDNDGTNDGTEVTENRDPLKANTALSGETPNDKLTEEIITALKDGEANFKALTTTEQVSRELFIQYINTKKVGVPLTEAEKQAIVDNAFSYLPEISFKVYTAKDVLISQTVDKLALRTYANNIADIILTNLKTNTESVDAIIAETDKIENDSTLNAEIKIIFERFDPLIEKNKKTIDDLLKVTIPEIFVTEHLQLLNSLEEIYSKLDLMQKSAEDFIILVTLKSQYYVSVENLATALQNITTKIINSKVTFSTVNDYGYQLFNDIMSLP